MSKLTNTQAELPMAEFDMRGTAEIFRATADALMGSCQLPVLRVRVPAGGGRAFELPGETPDEPVTATKFQGVILTHAFVNAWWAHPYGEGQPGAPDCSSMDGISGWDAQGMEHNCRHCPKNRMGSKDGGRGKACRNMVQMLVLMEDEPLPIELRVPTMSVGNYQMYIARALATRGLTPNQVVTEFSLRRASNGSGQDYSQVMFKAVGRVDDGEMNALMDDVKPLLLPTMGAALEEVEES